VETTKAIIQSTVQALHSSIMATISSMRIANTNNIQILHLTTVIILQILLGMYQILHRPHQVSAKVEDISLHPPQKLPKQLQQRDHWQSFSSLQTELTLL